MKGANTKYTALKSGVQHGCMAPDKTASIGTWYLTNTFYMLLYHKEEILPIDEYLLLFV